MSDKALGLLQQSSLSGCVVLEDASSWAPLRPSVFRALDGPEPLLPAPAVARRPG